MNITTDTSVLRNSDDLWALLAATPASVPTDVFTYAGSEIIEAVVIDGIEYQNDFLVDEMDDLRYFGDTATEFFWRQ